MSNNAHLKLWNKLVDSTEGLEVNLKVGKECELNVKGDFMTMIKLYGIVLETNMLESREQRQESDFKDLKSELDELLKDVKRA